MSSKCWLYLITSRKWRISSGTADTIRRRSSPAVHEHHHHSNRNDNVRSVCLTDAHQQRRRLAEEEQNEPIALLTQRICLLPVLANEQIVPGSNDKRCETRVHTYHLFVDDVRVVSQ